MELQWRGEKIEIFVISDRNISFEKLVRNIQSLTHAKYLGKKAE